MKPDKSVSFSAFSALARSAAARLGFDSAASAELASRKDCAAEALSRLSGAGWPAETLASIHWVWRRPGLPGLADKAWDNICSNGICLASAAGFKPSTRSWWAHNASRYVDDNEGNSCRLTVTLPRQEPVAVAGVTVGAPPPDGGVIGSLLEKGLSPLQARTFVAGHEIGHILAEVGQFSQAGDLMAQACSELHPEWTAPLRRGVEAARTLDAISSQWKRLAVNIGLRSDSTMDTLVTALAYSASIPFRHLGLSAEEMLCDALGAAAAASSPAEAADLWARVSEWRSDDLEIKRVRANEGRGVILAYDGHLQDRLAMAPLVEALAASGPDALQPLLREALSSAVRARAALLAAVPDDTSSEAAALHALALASLGAAEPAEPPAEPSPPAPATSEALLREAGSAIVSAAERLCPAEAFFASILSGLRSAKLSSGPTRELRLFEALTEDFRSTGLAAPLGASTPDPAPAARAIP